MKIDMNAVADEHRARTDRLVQASGHILASAQNFEDDLYCEALALALLELAEMWREDARKAMEENKRGCKGTADSLRDCASRLSGVAIAIRQHGLPVETPEQSTAIVASNLSRMGLTLGGDQPMFPAVQVAPDLVVKGDSDITTQFLNDIGNGKATELYEGTRERCIPVIQETLAEAASEIIERAKEARQDRITTLPVMSPEDTATAAHGAGFELIDPHQVKVIKQARLHSINIISDPLPGHEGNFAVFDLEITTPDPVPAWALQPQVPVFELTDDPATWLPVPAHASVSQVQLMGECGLKYWLRYRRGAPERPSWAMVGGSALHKCIELYEKGEKLGEIQPTTEQVKALWRDAFSFAMTDTERQNPLFPVETWHASKGGKEDRAWWDSDGPEMVHRYLEWRAKWMAEGWELIQTQDGRLIEQEFLSFIGGAPVKGFIDQAWYHPQRQQVAIIDAKSGASAPPDYFQPAIYALAARHRLGFYNAYAQATYVGGYWDARKGELMAPGLVELEARHPQVELEHRVSAYARMNRAGIYMPNTNSAYGGCNSCSLKRSCPIGSRMNVGSINPVS